MGRGFALSILLLKPQGAILIWLYLLWISRENWRGLIKPLVIVALLVIPISVIGSPPLFLQWLNNLVNSTPQNEYYWSVNNISLSSYLSPLSAVAVLIILFVLLLVVMRLKGKHWSKGHTLASLLLVSMFLSPYTSQQSFSSALAFIPSWGSFFIQSLALIVSFKIFDYWDFIPLLILTIGLASLYFYQPRSTKADAPRTPTSGKWEALT